MNSQLLRKVSLEIQWWALFVLLFFSRQMTRSFTCINSMKSAWPSGQRRRFFSLLWCRFESGQRHRIFIFIFLLFSTLQMLQRPHYEFYIICGKSFFPTFHRLCGKLYSVVCCMENLENWIPQRQSSWKISPKMMWFLARVWTSMKMQYDHFKYLISLKVTF